jgi:transcriptional regulator GlxA family with amidase domain
MRIAVLLFEGVEELDWAGPWEVLTMWAAIARRDGSGLHEVLTVADDEGPVTCAKGARVLPDTDWAGLGSVDVLVVPGGRGTRTLVDDAGVLDRLVALHEAGTMLVSVCTGALLLGAAGLLDGLPATTHHQAFELLAEVAPTSIPRPEDRWIDNGTLLTAAGVSAGIDVALHLVVRLAGTETARAVRSAIQYDPAPPV